MSGAPKGNINATKPEEEQLSSRIWINVTQEEKARIVKAADGDKVTAWGRRVLMQAVKEAENE